MPSAAEFTTFNYICHEMIYKQKLQKGSWEPVKGRPFHLQEGKSEQQQACKAAPGSFSPTVISCLRTRL